MLSQLIIMGLEYQHLMKWTNVYVTYTSVGY